MKMHHCPTIKLPPGSLRPRPLTEEEERFQDPVSKWWDGFKDKFRGVRDSWGNFETRDKSEVKQLFQDMFPPEIRPKMRFVGLGSRRISFVSDANICYKFQYLDLGDQNMQEIREGMAHPDLCCFTKLFDFSFDGLTLACEAAEEPEEKTFVDTFTQDAAWMQDRLLEYGSSGHSRTLELMLDAGILNKPQEDVIRDLMKFQR